MKIISFKSFLTEMPLPAGKAPEEFDSKPGAYSSAKIIRAFEAIGMKIGKGSSRVAFKVAVERSQFAPGVLQQHGMGGTGGTIETVFKLALNPKGIAQNRSEIEHHDNTGGDNEFLLPILDTSARNKGIHYDDESLSNWIQMPVAPPPSNAVFRKMFAQRFGSTPDKMFPTNKPEDCRGMDVGDDDQRAEFDSFLDTCEEIGLGLGDLGRAANWGVWNGKLYIIDYGYDNSTTNLYRGTEKATAFVDGKGNIRLDIKKVGPKRGW
jgi:hypothetical protein